MVGTRARLFIGLSILMAVLDVIVVTLNAWFAERALHEALAAEARQVRAAYEAVAAQTFSNMLLMATFIGEDRTILDLMRQARDAVAAEGGGPGGPRAAAVRRALLASVEPSWRKVQADFGARQLHFHLGPGSLSFLRVHRPDKFGDRMDEVRHTVVDTFAEGSPRTGFETGRVYSGLRGVVPLVQPGPLGDDVVGVLEVGTSYGVMLDIITRTYGYGAAVLLTMDHVQATMWPPFAAERFHGGNPDCACALEASSGGDVAPVLRGLAARGLRPSTEGLTLLDLGDTHVMAVHFPLRDYYGQRHPEAPHAGGVLLWRDVSAQVAEMTLSVRTNVMVAVAGFLVLEVLLWFGVTLASRHLERQVAEKTRALAASNRELRDFAYVASHDLREPLRMVSSYLGLLGRRLKDRLDDDEREFMAFAADGARRMDRMILDLLELSRVTTHGAAFAPVPLAEPVRAALADLSVAIAESGARIDVATPLPTVAADAAQMTRLFQNLIANAIKYARPGDPPQVSITGRSADDGRSVIVEVTDSGLGIPPEDRERIFAMFQRLHPRSDTAGSGIGLAVCRRIAERHGGQIAADARPDGRPGSVFRLVLPRRPTAPRTDSDGGSGGDPPSGKGHRPVDGSHPARIP